MQRAKSVCSAALGGQLLAWLGRSASQRLCRLEATTVDAVGGATESGGVNVITSATGVKEPTAILFLLKPGVSFPEVENALKSGAGKDPNKTSKYGSIVFDAPVTSGHSSEVQTYLQPGEYLALVPG
jgi:hypothetical protein